MTQDLAENIPEIPAHRLLRDPRSQEEEEKEYQEPEGKEYCLGERSRLEQIADLKRVGIGIELTKLEESIIFQSVDFLKNVQSITVLDTTPQGAPRISPPCPRSCTKILKTCKISQQEKFQ